MKEPSSLTPYDRKSQDNKTKYTIQEVKACYLNFNKVGNKQNFEEAMEEEHVIQITKHNQTPDIRFNKDKFTEIKQNILNELNQYISSNQFVTKKDRHNQYLSIIKGSVADTNYLICVNNSWQKRDRKNLFYSLLLGPSSGKCNNALENILEIEFFENNEEIKSKLQLLENKFQRVEEKSNSFKQAESNKNRQEWLLILGIAFTVLMAVGALSPFIPILSSLLGTTATSGVVGIPFITMGCLAGYLAFIGFDLYQDKKHTKATSLCRKHQVDLQTEINRLQEPNLDLLQESNHIQQLALTLQSSNTNQITGTSISQASADQLTILSQPNKNLLTDNLASVQNV